MLTNSGLRVLRICYLAELPSAVSVAELDRKASAILIPLSIDGLFTRLLSMLPARPFCDKLKLKTIYLCYVLA